MGFKTKKTIFIFIWISIIYFQKINILANNTVLNNLDYRFSIYAWGAGISGKTQSGKSFDVSFKEVLDNIRFTYMGSFAVMKDDWSLIADLIYLNMDQKSSSTIYLPVENNQRILKISDKIKLDTSGTVINLLFDKNLLIYRIIKLNYILGTRFLDLDSKLQIKLNSIIGNYKIKDKLSTSVLDAVVGIQGKVIFNEQWSLPYYFDLGTGQSKNTSQFVAGITSSYEKFSIDLLYRSIKWKFKSKELLKNIEFKGPMLGFIYKFD